MSCDLKPDSIHAVKGKHVKNDKKNEIIIDFYTFNDMFYINMCVCLEYI